MTGTCTCWVQVGNDTATHLDDRPYLSQRIVTPFILWAPFTGLEKKTSNAWPSILQVESFPAKGIGFAVWPASFILCRYLENAEVQDRIMLCPHEDACNHAVSIMRKKTHQSIVDGLNHLGSLATPVDLELISHLMSEADVSERVDAMLSHWEGQNLDAFYVEWRCIIRSIELYRMSIAAVSDTIPSHGCCGRRVLELGTGCGLCGLVACHLGAQVTMTDLGDLLEVAQRNVAFNVPSTSCVADRVNVEELRWGTNIRSRFSRGSFDLIIGSDITYHEHLHDPLLSVLLQLADASTEILMGHVHRDEGVDGERWPTRFGDFFSVERVATGKDLQAYAIIDAEGNSVPPYPFCESHPISVFRLRLKVSPPTDAEIDAMIQESSLKNSEVYVRRHARDAVVCFEGDKMIADGDFGMLPAFSMPESEKGSEKGNSMPSSAQSWFERVISRSRKSGY